MELEFASEDGRVQQKQLIAAGIDLTMYFLI